MPTEQDILDHLLKRQRMDSWLATYLVFGLILPVHTLGSILSWIPNGLDHSRSLSYVFNQLTSLAQLHKSPYWGIAKLPSFIYGNSAIVISFDSRTTGRRHLMVVLPTSNNSHSINFHTPFPITIAEHPVTFSTWSELYHQLAPILHKMLEHINSSPERKSMRAQNNFQP